MNNDLPKIDLNTLEAGEELRKESSHDEEIFKARLGMITGSNFGKLVVNNKGYSKADKLNKKGEVIKKADPRKYILSEGETAKKIIYRAVWERLSKEGIISNGMNRINFSSTPTNHGHDNEEEAIIKYMALSGNEVDYKQKFIEYDHYIGGTPDGYIGDDGIIEVKCPWDGGNHIQAILTGEIYNTDYIYQIQGYLWMSGRKWCDFITYDPDIIEALQINVIRVERDEMIIDGIASVMEMVKDKIREALNSEIFLQK